MTAHLAQALQQRIHGAVRADEPTRTRYATDYSIYRIVPRIVVFPRDLEDVVAALRFAGEAGLPLTPRGAGSGTAGAALGRGIVLAFRPRPQDRAEGAMDRLLDLSEGEGEPRVTVEPGLLHDDLQRALRERGLYLPADPSSGAICALGGNIATKASGPHALKHGSIDRYLRSVQFVTVDGAMVDTADPSTLPAHIREGVTALRDDLLADEGSARRLRARLDRKLASGYNLFTFLRHRRVEDWVAQLLVGSVGTLGVVTRATLSAEPYVEGRATTLLYFRHLHEAGDAVQHIRALGVAAIEILNHETIAMVVRRGRELEAPEGEAHMLLVEYEGPERHDQIAQVQRLIREQGYAVAAEPVTVEGEEEQARLWAIRKAVLPTIRSFGARRPGAHQTGARQAALSVVNDVGVPVAHLAEAIGDLEGIFRRLGLTAAMYGHGGSGNLHLRPLFDPGDPGLPALLTRVADEVYEAVLRYDGTITAEHGMGRLRAPYLAREWGPALMGYMRRVKEIFDPDDRLNPEVMLSERALTEDMGELGN